MADLSDDDDRVLGLALNVPVSPDEANATGDEGEELLLDLGTGTDGSEGELVDMESQEINPDEDNDDGIVDGSYGEAQNGASSNSLSDDALQRITSKHEAKKLGRDVYKRWKKLHKQGKKEKGQKRSRSEKSKKHKDKDKKRPSKRGRRSEESDNDDDDYDEPIVERKSRPRAKRTRREKKTLSRGADDANNDVAFADSEEVVRAREAATGRASRGPNAASGDSGKAKKLTAEAQRSRLSDIASSVIAAMREARLKDEMDMSQRRPPLHRVSIKDQVIAQCRRESLRPFFIEGGILQELSTWLYDFTRRELAALELRTAALDLLLDFPIEGELGAELTARNGDDILDAFTGMAREHLIHTDLGSAVNALRQDSRETHTNRSKAVRLLVRLSRAMAGGAKSAKRRGGGGGGGGGSAVTWKCQNDPTVAPPFHTVRTGTEVFQQALVRPDPLDPMSYLRVPPRRAPKTYVTNLAGNVGCEDK